MIQSRNFVSRNGLSPVLVKQHKKHEKYNKKKRAHEKYKKHKKHKKHHKKRIRHEEEYISSSSGSDNERLDGGTLDNEFSKDILQVKTIPFLIRL